MTQNNHIESLVMLRLSLILHLFIGSTLAGSAVIAALLIGQDTLRPILIAAALGFIAAFPVSYIVARRLYELR
jgi:putative flippase GtrA